MKKSTEDLWNSLKSKNSVEEFFKENSTEMIFDGKILNVPSAGVERNDHDFIYIER